MISDFQALLAVESLRLVVLAFVILANIGNFVSFAAALRSFFIEECHLLNDGRLLLSHLYIILLFNIKP